MRFRNENLNVELEIDEGSFSYCISSLGPAKESTMFDSKVIQWVEEVLQWITDWNKQSDYDI